MGNVRIGFCVVISPYFSGTDFTDYTVLGFFVALKFRRLNCWTKPLRGGK